MSKEHYIKESIQLLNNIEQHLPKAEHYKLNIIRNTLQSLQPNKEQLRDEIISELNELGIFNNSVRYNETPDDKIFVYDKGNFQTQCIVRLDKIDYIQEWELTWRFDLPLSLASKIIKYFELESDENE